MREKVLGNPDRAGQLGTLVPKLANWSCRSTIQRRLMEQLLGIHRDKQLPAFAAQTFEKWVELNGLPPPPPEPAAKVALFPTCTVNYYNPAPGKALVKVLARNNCAIKCPRQNCCGMPALDGGDVAFAQRQARTNIASLLPSVREGYKVVAINPSCSLMMRRDYPVLIGTPEAQEFAAAIADPHELLYRLRREGKFNRDFRSTPGKIAYHIPCHLKAQNIGFRARDLMRQIPGAEVVSVDACTAHDGTWAMKKENFAISMKWGEKAFSGMREAEAAVMATDCPLAAIQIEQGTGVTPVNPIEILARAYEPDGFARKVAPSPGAATGQSVPPTELIH
jgi:Fe-S oxidoreductase